MISVTRVEGGVKLSGRGPSVIMPDFEGDGEDVMEQICITLQYLYYQALNRDESTLAMAIRTATLLAKKAAQRERAGK